MKFEYKNNHLILRVLTAEYADAVLSFYRRNREQFDIYETDKPDHFYTKAFIQSLQELPGVERIARITDGGPDGRNKND